MEEVVQLSDRDVLVERPFTHPDHIAADAAILQTIAQNVWFQLDQPPLLTPASAAAPIYFPCERNWQKRLLILRAEALRVGHRLTLVGFFGQKNLRLDPQIYVEIMAADERLIRTLYDTPGVAGYCSVMLVDGLNYANLVLVNSEQVVERWRHNEVHRQVSDLLSPRYYANVRIYHGSLSFSQNRGPRLQLYRVKYWDFRDEPVWRGVRTLEQN